MEPTFSSNRIDQCQLCPHYFMSEPLFFSTVIGVRDNLRAPQLITSSVQSKASHEKPFMSGLGNSQEITFLPTNRIEPWSIAWRAKPPINRTNPISTLSLCLRGQVEMLCHGQVVVPVGPFLEMINSCN